MSRLGLATVEFAYVCSEHASKGLEADIVFMSRTALAAVLDQPIGVSRGWLHHGPTEHASKGLEADIVLMSRTALAAVLDQPHGVSRG